MTITSANANSSTGPRLERLSLARLVVCERNGRWAVALRRQLPEPRVRVFQTRSLPECWEMLVPWPASLLVVEATRTNVGDLVERMGALGRRFPLARVAVVAERGLADCQWLLREAGAVYFTESPRRLAPLADLAVRHLAAAPQRALGLQERIWASLPWGAWD